MNEDYSFLLKHRRKGALVDANLLLVYVVGKIYPSRLSDCKATKQYRNDFPLIEQVVDFFPKIYTTPNVLTEVSNLGKDVGDEFFKTLRKIVLFLDERYCASNDASANVEFRRLGLTDAGLCCVAADHLVITADLDLYLSLRTNKIDAVNFNHLRPLAWKGVLPSLR